MEGSRQWNKKRVCGLLMMLTMAAAIHIEEANAYGFRSCMNLCHASSLMCFNYCASKMVSASTTMSDSKIAANPAADMDRLGGVGQVNSVPPHAGMMRGVGILKHHRKHPHKKHHNKKHHNKKHHQDLL